MSLMIHYEIKCLTKFYMSNEKKIDSNMLLLLISPVMPSWFY